MGDPRNNNSSLDPLHKTLESLKEIGSALIPFVQLLKNDDDNISLKQSSSHSAKSVSSTSKTGLSSKKKRSRSDDDVGAKAQSATPTSRLNPHRRAEAEAAVALAIGTLRYMGARLQGFDRGRKKGDPLRMELDKIRGMLVALRKLESSGTGDGGKEGASSKIKGVDQKSTTNADVKKESDESNNSAKRRKSLGMKSGASKNVSTKKKQRR